MGHDSETSNDPTERVNGVEYWERRFGHDWVERGGSRQTLFFYQVLLEYLPPWLATALKTHGWSICDWGCALGEGTNLLAETFPGTVTGIDFATAAIESAKRTFPKARFSAVDLLTSDYNETFDVLLSSNTLEHFSTPFEVLGSISHLARQVVVIMVPFREYERHEEHEATFDAPIIPAAIANGQFVLVNSRVIPTNHMQPTYWWGEQILLTYARPELIQSERITLGDITVDRGEIGTQESRTIQELRREISERDRERVALRRVDEERMRDLETLRAKDVERERLMSDQARDLEALGIRLNQASADLSVAFSERSALRGEIDTAHDQLALVQAQATLKDDAIAGLRARLEQKHQSALVMRSRHLRDGVVRRGRFLAEQRRQYGTPWTLRWLAGRVIKGKASAADQAEVSSLTISRPEKKAIATLFDKPVIIFGVTAPWDTGGGQRGAQLARTLVRSGFTVKFVYVFEAIEVSTGKPSARPIGDGSSHEPSLDAVHISHADPRQLFSTANAALAIFELPHPRLLAHLAEARRQGVPTVYEIIDPWNSELGAPWYDASVATAFLTDADRVTASARVLQAEAISSGRPDAIYLPNAGDDVLFDGSKEWRRPEAFGSATRVHVYAGSLYGSWFDWDAVLEIARADRDALVLLIGDPPPDCPQEPNIRYLGPKPIAELPPYLAHCTTALIPFKVNPLTRAVDPIKVHEYLLMGANVIASDLPELRRLGGVTIARSPAAFAAAALKAEKRGPRNDRILLDHTWGGRLGRLLPPTAQKRIAVVILIHDNADVISLCIDSLAMHAADWLHSVIVVDNVSTDSGPAWVRARAQSTPFPLTLVQNPVNGCSSGRNLGLDAVPADVDFVLFLDSDQWLSSSLGLLEAVAILDKWPALAAVGLAGATFERRGDVLVSHLAPASVHEAAAMPGMVDNGHSTAIDFLATSGLLVRTAATRTARFDTAFDPTCFEDADFCMALRHGGGEISYRPLSGIHHRPHATTGRGSRLAYQHLYRRNSLLFAKKWPTIR